MGYHSPAPDRLIGSYPTCGACQSEEVLRAAYANWNRATLEWDLHSQSNTFRCSKCGHAGAPTWELDKVFRTKRIRRLNDALRHGEPGHNMMVITPGVQSLGDEVVAGVMDQVKSYEAFSGDSDPHGEHDFGSLSEAGEKIFWKIDYFDRQLKAHSPDAADPGVTCRVLTLMLASEY